MSIINSDNVFWTRRTDNLLYGASLRVSSGDADKLRDYLLLDTNDLEQVDPRKIDFNKALWYPSEEDIRPRITVHFHKKQKIQNIVLRGNPNWTEAVPCKIQISLDGSPFMIHEILPYARETRIEVDHPGAVCVIIDFLGNERISLSQLELYANQFTNCPLCNYTASSQETYKIYANWINKIGFAIIVVVTKMLRKIRKIVYRKKPYNLAIIRKRMK